MKNNKNFLSYQKDLFDNILKLNGSKFMAGVSLLMLNLGSKYLIMDLAEGTNQLLKLKIIRRITLFCLFFVATRNIIVSILLSTGFIIFTQGLFNEKSKYCILPKNLKKLTIDKKDYEKAKEIVKNYDVDAITAFEIFEHLIAPFNILNEIKSTKLIASVPLNLWFAKAYKSSTDKWDRHYHEFEDWQFDWLLEKSNWKIEKKEKWTSPIKKIGFRPILRTFTPRYYIVYATKHIKS